MTSHKTCGQQIAELMTIPFMEGKLHGAMRVERSLHGPPPRVSHYGPVITVGDIRFHDPVPIVTGHADGHAQITKTLIDRKRSEP